MTVWCPEAPDEALSLAAKVLSEHLNGFINLSENAANAEIMVEQQVDESTKVLSMSIEDLELSVRSSNCLRRAGINTVEELCNKTPDDMIKVRNLGKKSITYRTLNLLNALKLYGVMPAIINFILKRYITLYEQKTAVHHKGRCPVI